jgi:hypothetical protein
MHQKDESGDPLETVFGDIPMLVNVFLWVMTCIGIIYFYG